MTRLAVLVSGTGRTLENLIKAQLDAEIVLVVSDHQDVRANEIAKAAGLRLEVMTRERFPMGIFYDQAYSLFDEARIDLVCLAGFTRMLFMRNSYANRIMNVHPSLLPSFGGKGYYGKTVHKMVLDAGVKVSGCTVHFIDDEYDHGPIIIQRPVPVYDTDTPDSLGERVFKEECLAYPEAINLFANGRLRVTDKKVVILP